MTIRSLALAALGVVALATPAFAQDAVPQGDPDAGARIFNQCRACHTINEGGRNGVGPNLHGVFNREMASLQGFNYSPAFRAKAPEVGRWDDAKIRVYLDNPSAYVPGTRMSYPGLRGNQQQLSDIIAYLHRESGS